MLIRKHRLWETFLVQKLNFSWDEVHEIAEQLEHIQSPLLIQRLDEYLGFPMADPHGEPIPDKDGNVTIQSHRSLHESAPGYHGIIVAVKDADSNLLKYLNKIGAIPGQRIQLVSKELYDGSIEIEIEGKRMSISKVVSENILVGV
jgi:DtxR family Mn-dependent transcriptional regulator